MSSISSVSSTTNPYYQNINQNGSGQFVQDFQAIDSALQTGNLSSAQSALATFQQNLPGSSSTQQFGQNNQANSDFQNLVSALQSGNLSNAQQSFASLQTDLKGPHKGHGHHHHSSSATNSTTSSTTTTNSNPTTNFLTTSLNVTA